MPANIDSETEIEVQNRNFVHVKITERFNNASEKRYEDRTRIAIYTPQDFKQMTETGYFKQYDGAEVVHDPTRGEGEAATAKAPKKSKAELQAEYKTLFGVDADAKLKVAELEKAIADKLAENK